MNEEDKKYLLQKDQHDLLTDFKNFEDRKNLYENMYEMMEKFNFISTQERIILSDLGRLISFFESKMDIVKLKLRDIEIMLLVLN